MGRGLAGPSRENRLLAPLVFERALELQDVSRRGFQRLSIVSRFGEAALQDMYSFLGGRERVGPSFGQRLGLARRVPG